MTKEKHGLGVRAKKFMSTKTAGNKFGRRVILQALGEEGETLFKTAVEAATLFYGNKMAQQLQKDTLAIVLKVKILLDEGILTPEHLEPCQDHAHALLFQTAQDLDSRLHTNGSELVRLSEILGNNLARIFSSMMKEKNVNKMMNVVKCFGNADFLHALLNDSEYEQVKQRLNENYKLLMSSVRVSFDKRTVRVCKRANCSLDAVVSQGFFRSTGLCRVHHLEFFEPILENPSSAMSLFMQDKVYFPEYLRKRGGENVSLFRMCEEITLWKSLENSFTRRKRAEILVSKLSLLSVIPQSLIDSLNATESFPNDKLPFDYFSPIEQLLQSQVEILFTHFLHSPEFARFTTAHTLPNND